jgi:hypothetical protein
MLNVFGSTKWSLVRADSGFDIPIRKQPLIEALVVNLKIPRAAAADLDPASPPSSLRLSSPEN